MDPQMNTKAQASALQRVLDKASDWTVRAAPWQRHAVSAGQQQEQTSGRHMLVLLDVLNRCNLRCTMCSNTYQLGTPRQVMEQTSFERLAASVFPLSHQVNLSCLYEPLLFRGIVDYLAIAAPYDIPKLTLVTNGTLLSRAKAESLVATGLPYMAISVDGATKETYESIRVRGRFETLLDNLRGLAAAKQEMQRATPSLQFNFVLMDNTLDEALLFIELMSQFNPHKFVFIHQDYAPPGDRRAKVESVLRAALAQCVRRRVLFEEVPGFCLTMNEIAQAYGCQTAITPEAAPYCGDPWHFMRIAPGGDVFMCPSIGEPAGNVMNATPLDIFHGETFSRLREQLCNGAPPPQCAACPYSGRGLVRFRREHDLLDRVVSQQLALQQ